MSFHDCIFCKIIAQEIPAKIIAQNDTMLVIEDRAPKAPTHYLIIPKKHIQDVASLAESDAYLAGSILLMAKTIAKTLSGDQSFRLIMNNGAQSGQSVFHIHCHFLSGKTMLDF